MSIQHVKGVIGEFIALCVLWCYGYRLIIWNWRHKIAQADLVMVKDNTFIIIEVKWRTHIDYYDSHPLSHRQLYKLKQLLYHCQQRYYYQDYRLDIFIIYPKKIWMIYCFAWQHYKNIL